MAEKVKIARDNKRRQISLNDFPVLRYDLFIIKFSAQGINQKALDFVNDYLHGRLQERKVDLLFSSELDILFVGSKGSIHGRLLFDL